MYDTRINNLLGREIDTTYNKTFREKSVYTSDLIDRLHLDAELKEHEGCVNCIEWNQAGTLLASGSDDLKVMLWDPFRHKHLTTIDTNHRGNIFSVKFIPFTNDNLIVSSAADRLICVHDINSKSVLHEIRSHRNRVKRLEVAHDTPYLFWSSGEDGVVMQHDIRCSSSDVSQLLISYPSCNYPSNHNLEVKCLAINPAITEYLAVGCNDPFARVYDRRMLVMQHQHEASSSTAKSKCVHEYCPDDVNNTNRVVRYYCPGHVPSRLAEYRKRMKYLSITYLTFNQQGTELLVNLSGEQIYLFDVNNSRPVFKFNAYQTLLKDVNAPSTSKEVLEGEDEPKKKKYPKLPDKVEQLKSVANGHFEKENYYEAIKFYNKAIAMEPNYPILYGNRAAALMKRKWDGDIYAAMRDCYAALSLDKEHMKSHFRLARCLHELKWHTEAQECLKQFRSLYPDYSNTNAFETLSDEIEKVLKKATKATSANATSSKRGNEASKEGDEKTFKDKNGDRSNKDDDESDISEDDDDGKEDDVDEPKVNCNLYENYLKENSIDYVSHFAGHCNVATDIKEASFIGDKYIGAGSDDGAFFIWDRRTGNIARILKADESIVNCVQPNPYTCMIATSGIDPHVRLWTPGHEPESRVIEDEKTTVLNNQKQMNQNPVEFFFMNLNNTLLDNDEDTTGGGAQSVGCRTS